MEIVSVLNRETKLLPSLVELQDFCSWWQSKHRKGNVCILKLIGLQGSSTFEVGHPTGVGQESSGKRTGQFKGHLAPSFF